MPDRYQDEIEEILRQAGEVSHSSPPKEMERAGGEGAKPVRASRQARSPGPHYRRQLPRLSPGKVMLAGAIILILGVKFWPLIWVGLALLVAAYLMFFVTPRSISYEKRWRGRLVDEVQSPWDRFKRWIMG